MIKRLRHPASEIGLRALGIAPAIDEVREVFPWAESVIAAAISYLPPRTDVVDALPRGRVARFAQSVDYHHVLRSKLEILSEAIRREAPGSKIEICVDTVPLPERKLAVLAGIASRSKNGNVFVDGCGSYAALGEIVTDLVLPPSETVRAGFDACVGCDKCRRACPTNAIIGPGLVDASRCISRLTQMSGGVPRELRRAIGNRVYGCDVCQEVCPLNEGIEPTSPEFAADVFPGACPELIPLLLLSPAEFDACVRDSSIGWIRRARIRRNAAIAAGNLRCHEAVEPLITMLGDADPVLRVHAAWSLGEIGQEE